MNDYRHDYLAPWPGLGPAPATGPDAGVAAMGAAETPGGGLSEPHCALAGRPT